MLKNMLKRIIGFNHVLSSQKYLSNFPKLLMWFPPSPPPLPSAVRQHILGVLTRILSMRCRDTEDPLVSYVKWDMNRSAPPSPPPPRGSPETADL